MRAVVALSMSLALILVGCIGPVARQGEPGRPAVATTRALWTGDEPLAGEGRFECIASPSCEGRFVAGKNVGKGGERGLWLKARQCTSFDATWDYSWMSPDVGIDATKLHTLSFWMRLEDPTPRDGNVLDDLRVQLIDLRGKRSARVSVLACEQESKDGWRHVVIPLSLFHSADSSGWDLSALAGIGWSMLPGSPFDFNLYFDDIFVEVGDEGARRSLCSPRDHDHEAGSRPAIKEPETMAETCPHVADSACVEEDAAAAAEKIWKRDTSARLRKWLPRLNRCLKDVTFEGDVRSIVTVAFEHTGLVKRTEVLQSTSSACAVTDCLKRELSEFKTSPPPSWLRTLSVRLAAQSRQRPRWTLNTEEDDGMFIPEAARSRECLDLPSETEESARRLRADAIQRTVRSSYDEVRRCYDRGLARERHLCGKMQLRFAIDPSGRVAWVHALSGTSMPDCAVTQCVKQVFSRLSFADLGGEPVVVVYPLMFETR